MSINIGGKRKADDSHQDVESADSDTSTDTTRENDCRQYPEDGGSFEIIVILKAPKPGRYATETSLGASF